MKSAVIPQVRVEPQLREELEAVLREGETLSGFVEDSVRKAVEFRRVQSRFEQRGEEAWRRYQATGHASSAEAVVAKLQAKLDARKKRLAR
ncbi:MAG: hypothetical protein HYX43_00035 [Burkholderiales bacterium]|nr:hypothetical protein [Burkholderiales bacterium]